MSRLGGGAATAVLAAVIVFSGVAGWAPAPLQVDEEVLTDDPPSPGVGDPGEFGPRDRPWRLQPGVTEEVAQETERPGVDPSLGTPIRKSTRPRPDGDVNFKLLEKGFWSYYREEDYTFSGGCLAIRDSDTWSLFWSVHKAGVWPEPPPPVVDFTTYIVVACIQGVWSDCCMTYVEIVGIRSSGGEYVISVVRHYEHGMLMALTNPYYIVTTERTEGSVRFVDANTGAEIPEVPPVP